MPVAPSFELFGRDGSLFALADGNTVPFSLRGGGEAGGGESEAWGLLLR